MALFVCLVDERFRVLHPFGLHVSVVSFIPSLGMTLGAQAFYPCRFNYLCFGVLHAITANLTIPLCFSFFCAFGMLSIFMFLLDVCSSGPWPR